MNNWSILYLIQVTLQENMCPFASSSIFSKYLFKLDASFLNLCILTPNTNIETEGYSWVGSHVPFLGFQESAVEMDTLIH